MKTKYLTIAACSMLGLFINSAHATAGKAVGDTTCYVFKNNKLLKKANCHFEYYQSGNVSGGTEAANFNVKGYGKISFVDSSQMGEPDSTGEAKEVSSTTEVNKKPAIYQLRDAKTLKVITTSPGDTKLKTIECYQQKTGKLEICYDDISNGTTIE